MKCSFCFNRNSCNDAYSAIAQYCRRYVHDMRRAELRKYEICIDCGEYCLLTYVPAENEEMVKKYCNGQGEIISIKDITKNSRYSISADTIGEALKKSGMLENAAIELVIRALQLTGITD